MNNEQRLARIVEIIKAADRRCMAVKSPLKFTIDEIIQEEITEIYKLALTRKKSILLGKIAGWLRWCK